jgi:chromosome segregation ATPase
MAHPPEEREQRPAARDEARRLLAEARAAHREAERERDRARKLAARISRKMQQTLDTARAQIDADRAAIDVKIAKFNELQSEFHTEVAADRARRREAWADLDARQKRLAAEWEETNRFHAEQAAALDARAAEQAAHEKIESGAKARLQQEVAALREEAASLDARARSARLLVDELERRRAELRAEALAPAVDAGAEPPAELKVALDRTADRDLDKWTAELEERDERLRLERAAVHALFETVSRDKAGLADRRRVLAEQFAQLAAARAQWQEAERATVAEMEQLARTLRRREAELDARELRLTHADSRRREDAYDLWQLRLRLEAWQAKIVAYEMRWHTEREALEADFANRADALARREAALAEHDPDVIPLAEAVPEAAALALPAELTALRAELDRMAVVMLEAELPEPPDSPEREIPWAEEVAPAPAESDDAEVLLFDQHARAA